MRRRLGLVLGLVLALACALAAWLLLRTRASAPATVAPASPSAAVVAPGIPPDRLEPASDEDAGRLAPAERDGQPASERSGARALLRGRVLFPAGAPADPTLAVLVSFGSEAQELSAAPPARLRAPEEEERPAGPALERVLVDAQGGFELARPAASAFARLELDGRFLVLETPLVHALDAGDEIVLEPRLGACLAGLVVPPPGGDEERAEVVGGTVRAFPIEDEGGDADFLELFSLPQHPARCEVDEALRFELRGLRPGTKVLVWLDPQAWPTVMETVPALAPGELRVLELRPRRGARVAGRVEDERGAPVAGVQVEQGRDFFLPGGIPRRATSAEDGSFLLSGLRPGRVELEASHPERPRAQTLALELGEGELRQGVRLVSPAGARLAGRVRWPDGAPAEDAQVVALGVGARRTTQTDAEGRFALEGLEAGTHQVEAWRAPRAGDPEGDPAGDPAGADGGAQQEADARGASEERAPTDARKAARARGRSAAPEDWWALAPAVEPGEPLELVLVPPLALEGSVVDERGEAVARFGLIARTVTEPVREQRGSGEGGAFRLLGLRPGAWSVRAARENGHEGPEREVVLPQAGPVRLVLPRAARAAGVVLDPQGAPVPAAGVEVSSSSHSLSARCDQAGRFAIDGLAAEGTTLRAEAEGWAASEPLLLTAAPGEAREDLVLVLRRPGAVAGLVYARDGTPDAGAMVRAFGGRERGDPPAARADEQGRFLLAGLEPGGWQVTAMPELDGVLRGVNEGRSDPVQFLNELRMRSVEVLSGETVEVILGEPAGEPVALLGRVVEAGRGVAGVHVISLRESEALGGGLRAATTDADGAFALDLPAPGALLLLVQDGIGEGGTSFSIDVPQAREHHVELELPAGRVAGLVLDGKGRPAPAVRLWLEPEAGGAGELLARMGDARTSDGQGRFEVTRVRPGRYALRADGGARGSAFMPALELEAGEALALEVALAATGTLRGTVTDESGKPVAGAAVHVRDEAGRLHASFSRALTDAAGRFAYADLPAGRWSASARGEGRASAESALVAVAEGASAEAELVLAGATQLVVTLEGEAGEVLRARVSVVDEAGREHAGLRSEADMTRWMTQGFDTRVHRVGPLPPGRYSVRALGPDGVLRKKPVTLAGQEERKLVLRVE